MYKQIGRSLVNDNLMSLYRFDRTGLTLYTVHTDTSIVSGYFALATEALNTSYSRKDDGLPHTYILYILFYSRILNFVIEHLTFTGSEQYPYKGILDFIANRCFAQGTNAMTDVDNTCYTLEVAGIEGFLSILPIYIDHILYPTLTENAFITEIHSINGDGEDEGVVYSEMESYQNTYSEVLSRMINHQLYGDSGYISLSKNSFKNLHSHSSYTGGDIGNLRDLTVEQIRAFHREFYRPENLSIFICGNWGEDDSAILTTLLAIENRIVEKRMQNPPTPFERPWVHHNHLIEAGDSSKPIEVTFPSSEVDNNNYYLNIAFKTTSIQDIRTNNLIDLLLEYLTGSKNSPISKYFVYDEKLCGDVSYSRQSNAVESFVIEFSNIHKKDIPAIRPAFDRLIQNEIMNGVNRDRLVSAITSELKAYYSALEKSAAYQYFDAVVLHFMYDDHTGDETEFASWLERANYAAFLKGLLEDLPPQSFWSSLLSKYFCSEQNDLFTVIAVPSIERADEIAEEERQIVEKRQQELGSEVLEEYEARNEEAQEANETPIPESILESVPIPSISNVHLRNYCACIIQDGSVVAMDPSDDNNTMNQLLGQANEVIKSHPIYPVQLIHYNTQFTSLTVAFSTQGFTERELLLLPTLIECMVDAPQKINEVHLSSEEVIDIHYRETVSAGSRLSIPGESRYFASGLECCSFRLVIEASQIERGLSLLHNMLVNSYLTKDCVEKVLVCNDKLMDEKNHDNDNIALLLLRRFLLTSHSCHVAGHDTIQQKQFGEYYIQHPEQYPALVQELEELRTKLIKPERIHLSIASNLVKFPLTSTLLYSYPLYNQVILQPASLQNAPIQRSCLHAQPLPLGEGQICGMKDATTVAAYVLLPFTTELSFHDMVVLFITKELLSGFEGPLWRAIRGKGLSYDFGIVRNLSSHYICFYLNDCSSPVDSLEAANAIITEYATTGCCSMIELNSAKGSAYYSLCCSLDNPSINVMTRFMQNKDMDYTKQILNEIEKVTVEDVKKCIEGVFTKLVSVKDTWIVMTCAEDKVEEYLEELGKIGYKMEEKKHSEL